jgi:ribosomal protein S18 acetylase RimI-like enzyme
MWPAKKHCIIDGWILRFLNPYTYRCNCIYPLKIGKMKTSVKMKICASIYQQNDYKYLFQIMPHDRYLDMLLNTSGYQKKYHTRWMAMNLGKIPRNKKIGHQCVIQLSNDWSKKRNEIGGYTQQEAFVYQTFYQAIDVKNYPMVLSIDQSPVSCGLGIQVGNYLGIFDIRTKTEFQRQGYASILVQALCKHAAHYGARYAQLHVAQDNIAAIQMYHQLGFQTICDYWFRKSA